MLVMGSVDKFSKLLVCCNLIYLYKLELFLVFNSIYAIAVDIGQGLFNMRRSKYMAGYQISDATFASVVHLY